MDIGSILLLLALFILVALFVSRPFFEHKTIIVSSEERDLSTLLAERDRILDALEEIDADFSMGKIPEDEYPAQRSQLLQKGADILRRLDSQYPQLKGGRPALARAGSHPKSSPPPAEVKPAGKENYSPDDELEAMIASKRRERQEKASGFCAQCGGPLQKSDTFCPRCGFKANG
jgi:hypothetical protein